MSPFRLVAVWTVARFGLFKMDVTVLTVAVSVCRRFDCTPKKIIVQGQGQGLTSLQLRVHKPLSQTSRLNWYRRTVCDWLWLQVDSTNQPTVAIYFTKFNYGRLGLPWQPGGQYIFQPFALFIYLFISYLFYNISIMDHGNRWGQLCRSFKSCWGLE